MRKHTAAYAAACSGMLAAIIAISATRVGLAADCLAEPGRSTPAGHHWFYRLDHANNRKCWYLKDISNTPEQKAAPPARQSARRADADTAASASQQAAKKREALFEEFLRWQKDQDRGR